MADDTPAGIQKPVMFKSKFTNLKLVMVTPTKKFNGVFVENITGKIIHFANGAYETNITAEIEFLRDHKLCGIDYFEIEPSVLIGFKGTLNLTGEGVEAYCNFPDCDFKGKGANQEEAIKKLNAHKTRKGHHTS